MGIEILLMLAGSAIAVAAIGIIVYERVPRSEPESRKPSTPLGSTAVGHEEVRTAGSDQHPTASSERERILDFMATTASQSGEKSSASSSAENIEVSEAPPPFPEEYNQPEGSNVPIPLDTTAIANIGSPTDINASSSPTVLVITAPKRKVRAKRLPSTAGSSVRKRRIPKSSEPSPASVTNTMSSTAESAGIAGQQQTG